MALTPSNSQLVAVFNAEAIPLASNIVFLGADTTEDIEFLEMLGHRCISKTALIETYIIPYLPVQPDWILDSLVEFVFHDYFSLSKNRRQVAELEFVTVRSRTGEASPTRVRPCEMIYESSSIAGLFFDDEMIFGAGLYAANGAYVHCLINLGMKTRFDEEVAENRIRKYSELPFDENLFEKYAQLLRSLNDPYISLTSDIIKLLRLPAIQSEQKCLLPVSSCRPNSLQPVVGNSLGIVSMDVAESLQHQFGWFDVLEPSILGNRINEIVTDLPCAEVENALHPVMKYFSTLGASFTKIGEYIAEVKNAISAPAWLPGSAEGLFPPRKIFLQNVQRFEPHLSRVTAGFRKFASVLSLFGVCNNPSPQVLQDLLSSFSSNQVVNNQDLILIINIFEELAKVETIDSSRLLVPDSGNRLCTLEEFKSSDRYGHHQVPERFALRYGIRLVNSDHAFVRHLNSENLFDDYEYCQEEEITIRIANLLKDYSLSTSFNEFIANAEDSGATQVAWFLDPKNLTFPADRLFCDELKEWQTPALYIYNESEFTEEDFKSVVKIGAGNKASDSSKIGKYGLGSLTMYHFTDVPSMISSKYFVIFDPSRQYLLFDQTRRRAGLRVPLEIMRTKYPDLLVPFVGLKNYSLGIHLNFFDTNTKNNQILTVLSLGSLSVHLHSAKKAR